MAKQEDFRTYEEAIARLRNNGFDILDAPGTSNRVFLKKYNCSAAIAKDAKGGVAIFAYPGPVLGGEIAKLIHKGYQQFFKTTKAEVPATADRLKDLAQFTNELKQAIGSTTLWNESLGTVSEDYVYDRVVGRDQPEALRPKRSWEIEKAKSKDKRPA